MRRRLMASVASLSICAAALTGCAGAYTGPPVTQDREIETVSSVELDTSGDLIVTHGEETTLTVTAGENVIDRLTSEVDGDVLRLELEGEPLMWGGDIRYELTVPALDAVAVSSSGSADVDFADAASPVMRVEGSGSIRAAGVAADAASIALDGSGSISVEDVDVRELTTTIDGSGEVTVTGAAVAQEVEIRGSGDYRAPELRSTDARIVIGGSGTADASVDGALDATIEGSGEITYAGDPDVTQDISGSGDVIPR